MIVDLSERKQGSGTKKDKVQEDFRLSINPSGLRSERADLRPERADLKPKRTDLGHGA